MPQDFMQWLTLILIGLLFGKDTLLPVVLKKLGLNGNGAQGAQEEINKSMARHAETSNEELGTVKEDLKELKVDFKEHAKDDTERHEKVMSLLYEIKNK